MRSVKKFESCSAAVMSTEKKVNEIHGTLHTLQSAMPRLLGYAWEGGFGAHDKPIILMDALGRTVPIPFLFCTSPTVRLETSIFDDAILTCILYAVNRFFTVCSS